ncbi:MAG TPA: response regulator transcription factor [Chitinophagaceae bacterium]|nr:response regulator transcription factor [Chitinophagaceae bacterium]
MRNIIIGSGILITLLIILFKLGETQLIKGNLRMEVIIAVSSVIFFLAGIYFNYKKEKRAPGFEKASEEPRLFIDKKWQTPQANASGLSKRELEVLQKMGEGLSNQEIAAALFLSESTIKTHVSNILFKLDAKRRTEAINTAREKGII